MWKIIVMDNILFINHEIEERYPYNIEAQVTE